MLIIDSLKVELGDRLLFNNQNFSNQPNSLKFGEFCLPLQHKT